MHFDETREEIGLQPFLTLIQFVEVQTHLGSKRGRGLTGISHDLKELMALRNVVQFYSCNPFGSSGGQKFSSSRGMTPSPVKVNRVQVSFQMSPSETNMHDKSVYKQKAVFVKIQEKDEFLEHTMYQGKSFASEKSPVVYKEIEEVKQELFDVEKVLDWPSRIEGYSQERKS